MIKPRKSRTLFLALIALFVAVLAISSYICIPISGISFTLQTFGIYMCVFCLGSKRGLIAILVYVLGGIIGLPLFSGFTGGLSAILGASGGYILGFLPTAFLCTLFLKVFKNNPRGYFTASLLSLPLCYLSGALWYCGVYLGDLSRQSFISSILVCVLPYVIPDIVKLLAASVLGAKINKILYSAENNYLK